MLQRLASNSPTAHARSEPPPTPRTHPAHALHAPHAPRAPHAPAHAQASPGGQWAPPPPSPRLSAVRRPVRVSQSGPWADVVEPAGPRACAPAPARPLRSARHLSNPGPEPSPPPPQRPPSGAMSQSGTPGMQEESLHGEPPGPRRPRGGRRGTGRAGGGGQAPTRRGGRGCACAAGSGLSLPAAGRRSPAGGLAADLTPPPPQARALRLRGAGAFLQGGVYARAPQLGAAWVVRAKAERSAEWHWPYV